MSRATCPACGHSFDLPLRTTGKYSHNHAIHGFGSQIAKAMADSYTTQYEVIEEAARRAEIPSALNKFGRLVYLHESNWNKEQASMVIEELRNIARDMEIRLVEVSE